MTGTVSAFAGGEPAIQGETAIIYCATTDEVIWADEADKEMNPASMTKLMTCLLAIENLKLDQEVEITCNGKVTKLVVPAERATATEI